MLDLDRGWERPGPTPEQQRNDVWIGLGTVVLTVVSVELWRSANNLVIKGPDWVAFALFSVGALVLVVRRRFPLTVLVIESVLFIVIGERQAELAVVFTVQMILFASLYAAWAWSGRTRALLATTTAVLVAMFGWLIWQFVHDLPEQPAVHEGLLSPYWAQVIYSLAVNVVYFGGAIAWGHVAWRDARRRAEIAEQHERERASQQREREGAVRAERVRIARDLHDVVAHHVSGIGIQAAGASRVLGSQPDVARAALETIEQSSRTAVSQMHQLVGLLRDDDEGERGDGRSPLPGLGDLPALVDETPPQITFREVGDRFDVPGTVQLSLFRIAQEAVTNVRRHARAARGTITLRYLDASGRAVEVEVIDDGRPGRAPDSDGGYGLTGIRERAAMHGGTAEIGPRPDGGFRVRVRIPVVS